MFKSIYAQLVAALMKCYAANNGDTTNTHEAPRVSSLETTRVAARAIAARYLKPNSYDLRRR